MKQEDFEMKKKDELKDWQEKMKLAQDKYEQEERKMKILQKENDDECAQ